MGVLQIVMGWWRALYMEFRFTYIDLYVILNITYPNSFLHNNFTSLEVSF